MKPAVKKLDAKDAIQVAAEVRSRILADGKFDAEPKGAAGLIVLAELHSNTRSALLAFMKSLEPEQVGAWAGNALSKLLRFPETTVEATDLAENWKQTNKRIASTRRPLQKRNRNTCGNICKEWRTWR